jgi:hypothetical protein
MGKFAAKKSSEGKYYFRFEEDEDGLWSATIVSTVHGPLLHFDTKYSSLSDIRRNSVIQFKEFFIWISSHYNGEKVFRNGKLVKDTTVSACK